MKLDKEKTQKLSVRKETIIFLSTYFKFHSGFDTNSCILTRVTVLYPDSPYQTLIFWGA
jgi:hypothetical protein